MPIETDNMWDRISRCFINAFGTDKPEKIREVVGLDSVQAVYRWQTGTVPGLANLVHIADLTNCSIHWLLFNEGPMERDVVKAIVDGQVDYKGLVRRALMDHHLLQAQILGKEEIIVRNHSEGGSVPNIHQENIKEDSSNEPKKVNGV